MYMSLFTFTACPQLVFIHASRYVSLSHFLPMLFIVQNKVCIWLWKCWRGWGRFCMGDAVSPCQSLLLLFLSLCRLILDEPQLGCFRHWGSWDLDSKFSAHVHWHVIHTLLSNLHWGASSFPPTMLKVWFKAKHNLWVAGGRLSFPVELSLRAYI